MEEQDLQLEQQLESERAFEARNVEKQRQKDLSEIQSRHDSEKKRVTRANQIVIGICATLDILGWIETLGTVLFGIGPIIGFVLNTFGDIIIFILVGRTGVKKNPISNKIMGMLFSDLVDEIPGLNLIPARTINAYKNWKGDLKALTEQFEEETQNTNQQFEVRLASMQMEEIEQNFQYQPQYEELAA